MKQPEQTKEQDWTTPDENGILHIPDRLDDVFNRLGHYLRVHTISGHNEIEVIAYMTRFCDEYASQKCKALQEENEKLRRNLAHLMSWIGREHPAEALRLMDEIHEMNFVNSIENKNRDTMIIGFEKSVKEVSKDGEKVLLPRRLTAENGAKALLIGEFFETVELEEEVIDVQVSWTTIKKIYKKIVEHYGSQSKD